jgi:hypothetical protein
MEQDLARTEPGSAQGATVDGEGWLGRGTDLGWRAGQVHDDPGWLNTGRAGAPEIHRPWFMSGDPGAPWFADELDQRLDQNGADPG